jgi:pyruvate,water dikinase
MMTPPDGQIDQLLDSLEERAKELNCLYRVDEIVSREGVPIEEACTELVEAIPPGWQYPEICRCRIVLDDEVYEPEESAETPWCMKADIVAVDEKIGEIAVYYTERRPGADDGPFLREEHRLLSAIADRISLFLEQRRLAAAKASWDSADRAASPAGPRPWEVLLEFLSQTDQNLLRRVTRKMINHLRWIGVGEAEGLLAESLHRIATVENGRFKSNHVPQPHVPRETPDLTRRTFELAAHRLSQHDVMSLMQGWINEERSTFLIESLENPRAGLAEMTAAIERYQSTAIDETTLPEPVQIGLKVALLRRYFVDQPEFLAVARHTVSVRDFYDLVQHLVHPSHSQGKLGGKGAGLFLADQVVRKSPRHADLLGKVRIPRTWFVVSDGLAEFVHHNHLEEVYHRKYMEIERIRQDYPHLVEVFRNSLFPPAIIKGLAAALDDFADQPLVVRSSSLLEDRFGASFAGQYRSVFLANQGRKEERLAALQRAIAEVYASVYAPGPIEHRARRGLIDFREEMGVLIQAVVGRRVGKYLMPAFSGLACSHITSPWSAQLQREDGAARLVPGLGTRAAGERDEDRPVLFSPGRQNVRMNLSADEIIRQQPGRADVINVETGALETIDFRKLLASRGDDYPFARSLVSIVDGERIRPPEGLEPSWSEDELVITFEGLIAESSLAAQLQALLAVLGEKLSSPVEIEFAHDGTDLYLLECRPQMASGEQANAVQS